MEKPKVPHKTLDEVIMQMGWWASKRKPPKSMPTIIWDCKDALEHLLMLKKRTEPNKVVLINDTGHYVNEAVYAEIERLRELDRLSNDVIINLRRDLANAHKKLGAEHYPEFEKTTDKG